MCVMEKRLLNCNRQTQNRNFIAICLQKQTWYLAPGLCAQTLALWSRGGLGPRQIRKNILTVSFDTTAQIPALTNTAKMMNKKMKNWKKNNTQRLSIEEVDWQTSGKQSQIRWKTETLKTLPNHNTLIVLTIHFEMIQGILKLPPENRKAAFRQHSPPTNSGFPLLPRNVFPDFSRKCAFSWPFRQEN